MRIVLELLGLLHCRNSWEILEERADQGKTVFKDVL